MHLSVKSGDPYGHTFSLYPHCAGIVERHTKGNGLPWHFSEIRLAAAHPGKNIEYVLVLLLYSTFGVMDMTIVVLITAKGAEGLCSNSIT